MTGGGAALVLRPEPGNSRTADRLRRTGMTAHQLPLFAVRPLDWLSPDPAGYHALLVTSANAMRHAGDGLDRLRGLPVIAVGAESGRAAQTAGMNVALVGSSDAETVARQASDAGYRRLLHLAGREHRAPSGVEAIAVYASEPVAVAPGTLASFAGAIALLHSPRAAAAFARLVDRDRLPRADWRVAALSPAVAAGAGAGWRQVLVATVPADDALISLASAD